MARLPEPHESPTEPLGRGATASHVQAKMGSTPNVDVAHVSATRVTSPDDSSGRHPEPKPTPPHTPHTPHTPHRDKAAPKFSAPPLLPGSAVVYYGPDEAGVERVMHAVVLDVTGHEVGNEVVDLHVFNAQLALNGTTNADGRFESSAERHGVAHADAADATGWSWPGEFE